MACLRSKTDDCRVALEVSECEEERRGWGEEGMRIENVYRIRKAELGPEQGGRRVRGGTSM